MTILKVFYIKLGAYLLPLRGFEHCDNVGGYHLTLLTELTVEPMAKELTGPIPGGELEDGRYASVTLLPA